jgi:lipopolysaccharide exporter
MNRFFVTFFGFVNFYILIRVLSKDDFGAWVLFLSIASLMELIKHGFVRNPLIRFLALSAKEEGPVIQTSSFFLNIVVGVLEVFVLLLCSVYLTEFWNAPQLGPMFRIYAISTALLVPVNHFDVVQQANLSFKGTFMSNFTRHCGLCLFIVITLLAGHTVTPLQLVYAQLCAIIASVFVSFFFARRYVRFSRWVDPAWFRQLRSYGFFTFGTNVSSMINRSIDSWMIGKLISPAAVTIFNPAIRISNLVEVPTETLTSIFFPKLSERIAQAGPETATDLYEKAVGAITAFMIPVVAFFIVFAGPVVYFVAGPGFEDTVPILQITMFYGLMIPFNRFMGITLDALGKARTNFFFVVRNASINVVSNFFFISQFGVIGAAYGTLTSYIIVSLLNLFYLRRNLNVSLGNIARNMFAFYPRVYNSGVRMLRMEH